MKRKDFLVLGAPQTVRSDIKDLEKVYLSGWWVNGQYTQALAKAFKKYIGCQYAIPVSSGTAALHLALEVLGVGPGDEVITTSYTYPASAHAIVYCGARPVFVDIEKDSFNMDPNLIEQAITRKTKAIMPIHIAGWPCQMDKIRKIAKKHRLFIVEDAAHAVEAWYKNKKIGSFSDMACFSFDVTKNVAGGVGGMITTRRKDWAEKLKVLAHFGFVQKKFSLPYETIFPGYKYDMTEFCAALVLRSLERVEENLKIREKYWQMYDKAFANLPELILPNVGENIKHARHIYMILLVLERIRCSRQEFMEALASLNIGTRIRFTAIHLHRYYKKLLAYKKGDLPVTEYASDRAVCLPFSPRLTEKDVNDVIQAVRKIITYYRF